jgi:hypothetical protein
LAEIVKAAAAPAVATVSALPVTTLASPRVANGWANETWMTSAAAAKRSADRIVVHRESWDHSEKSGLGCFGRINLRRHGTCAGTNRAKRNSDWLLNVDADYFEAHCIRSWRMQKHFAARKRQFDGGKKLLGRALPLNWHKNNGKGVVVVSLGIDEPLTWRARHIHHHHERDPNNRA